MPLWGRIDTHCAFKDRPQMNTLLATSYMTQSCNINTKKNECFHMTPLSKYTLSNTHMRVE